MSRLSKHKQPAYHLRPNKAVDRFIFVELLRALEVLQSLKDHVYIGFGGPFLEDFRLLAQLFPYLESISIESDEETYKRQLFHLCSSNMKAMHRKFKDFLATDFPIDRPVIVWADYTEMKRQCLLEVADIARRAVPWSVFRITVQAENPIRTELHLTKWIPPRVPGKKEGDFRKLQKRYRDDWAIDGISFDHRWFAWEGFTDEGFPILLSRMIGAVISGSCSRPKTFVPLHAVKYSDGTIMLSLTGIFCLNEEREQILNHFRKYCEFCGDGNSTIDEIDEIDVPVLTTKERLRLDGILPTPDSDGKTCERKLGYLIEGDGSEVHSARKMQHYEKYYRLYPYFGKLVP
ncbi:MAG: O-methyltransferase [Desulfomonilaceae bacterium]